MHQLIVFIALIVLSGSASAETTTVNATDWVARLTATGWNQAAAQTVIGTNQEWFAKLVAEQPQKANKIVRDLAYLGRFPVWVDFLGRHPEATVLAISTANLDLLQRVLSTAAKSKDCWPLILQQYAYLNTLADEGKLTQAIGLHQQRICQMAKAGIPGAGMVFMFDETRPGAIDFQINNFQIGYLYLLFSAC